MKTLFLAILAFTVALAPGAGAKSLSPEFSYTILIEGQNVGKSQTKVTETSDLIIFDTNTTVTFGEYKLELTSHTEANKDTYQILKFSYEGAKPGLLMGGEAIVEGDSIIGFNMENGAEYPAGRATTYPVTLFLEDYVICHQILIGQTYFLAGEDPWETGMFLPSSWVVTKVVVAKAADAYIESDIDEASCTKLQIQLSGAHAYVSFFDGERGMPVYLAFPGTNTEVFLDEFYGDTPVSRYRPPTGRTE